MKILLISLIFAFLFINDSIGQDPEIIRYSKIQYTACENARIILSMPNIPNVTYRWTRMKDGTSVTGLAINVRKDYQPIEQYRVVAQYTNGNQYTYYINVKLSEDNALTESELKEKAPCALDGTILFREDFGGNKPEDSRISTIALPQGITDYNFSTNNSIGFSNPNTYWILKYNANYRGGIPNNNNVWHYNFSDHSFPKDDTRGYMFMVDADVEPHKFYEYDIDGLCENVKLYFSVWCLNLMKLNGPVPDDPYLRFQLLNENDEVLAVFCTNWIPRKSEPTWVHYGFDFELPTNINAVKLRIYNYGTGSSGNDFVMDDIEIRLCVPSAKMTVTGNTEMNVGESVSFTATYDDNGVFSNNYTVPLLYRWQYKSPNGDDWVTLKENRTTDNPLNETYTINNIRKSQEGFYRFTVSGPSFENFKNCYAATDPVFITVNGSDPPPLVAKNDTVIKIGSDALAIDVLANDILGECTPASLYRIAVVPGKEPKHGSASINADKTISYQASSFDFEGKDSLQYEIECGSEKSTATVYITNIKYPDNISDASCFTDIPPGAWDIEREIIPIQMVSVESPLVGNIDEDEEIEIIIRNKSATANMWKGVDSILIVGGTSKTVKYRFQTVTSLLSSMAIGRPNSTSPLAYIYIAGSDGYIYAYDANGYKWKSETECSSNTLYTPSISLIDFDGDGNAEIYAGERIFDAATGDLLLDCNLRAQGLDFGAASGHPNSGTAWNRYLYRPIIADMDNDGLAEIVAGRYIYKVNIERADANKNRCWVYKVADTTNRPEVKDGHTVVADLDLDGFLDVIVTTNNLNMETNMPDPVDGDAHRYLYAWNGRTGRLMNNNVVSVNQTDRDRFIMGPSIPLVGDLNGDKRPDIVFSYAKGVIAHQYNPSTNTLDLMWNFDTNDASGSTSLSMFNFDQDENGVMELIYRDEQNLRIIDGQGNDLITYDCRSSTGNEYATIADITGDGTTNIIIGGIDASTNKEYLNIFSHPSNGWAPTRKVWNQFSYNAVNINEDLTVPRYQLNPATVFPGKDGILGTADDVLPYNGFLQQQTILNKHGTPLWLAANPQIASPEPTFSYNGIGDSLKVSITIKNTGEATLQNPVYITVYKNSIQPSNAKTYTYPHSITPGESKTIDFSIKNAKVWFGTNNNINFIIRINDKGNGFNDQPVCDSSKVELTIPFKDILYARNDTVTAKYNSTYTFNVLKNDQRGRCINSSMTKIDTIAQNGLRLGKIVINADSTFSYIANQNQFGIDSVDYYIKCGTDSSFARVYIFLPKPQSSSYIACPNAELTLGIENIPNVNYYWYNSNNTLVSSNSNTLAATKDNTQEQYWHIEARYKNITFPRYKISLLLSENCGTTNPTGCAVEGTIIFKEDFGGNNISDPFYKPTGIPEMDAQYYTYNIQPSTNNYNNAPYLGGGEYMIAKEGEPHNKTGPNLTWAQVSDHTYPNTNERGYLLEVNASNEKGQFYEHKIDNLCSGTTLLFTAWINNVLVPVLSHNVNQIFILEDINGNCIVEYHTGDIVNGNVGWKQYGFTFKVPEGISSLILRIINNGAGSGGNDFALDDIEIRLCTPSVDINISKNIICQGEKGKLTAEYTDDGTYGNQIEGAWFESLTGDISESDEWTIVKNTSSKKSDNGIITDQLEIVNQAERKIYYRYYVSSTGNLNSENCRSMSDIVSLEEIRVITAPDVRIQMCPANTVNLTKYVDTAEVESINWSKIYTNAPNINSTTGVIGDAHLLSSPNTYMYRYNVRNQCTNASGNIFLTMVTDKVMYLPPDTVIICCESTKYIQINQIIGIEIPGTLTLEPASSMDKNYISINSHNGVIFSGKLAYEELGTNGVYEGENVRIVKFKFESAANSCTGKKEKITTLILTSDITK